MMMLDDEADEWLIVKNGVSLKASLVEGSAMQGKSSYKNEFFDICNNLKSILNVTVRKTTPKTLFS